MFRKRGLIFLVFAVLGALLFAQVLANSSTPYQYPYSTDGPEWQAMSRPQRVEACQIPTQVLRGMSTKALVDTVLKYPMGADLFLFAT